MFAVLFGEPHTHAEILITEFPMDANERRGCSCVLATAPGLRAAILPGNNNDT